jgi:hypothetical protein
VRKSLSTFFAGAAPNGSVEAVRRFAKEAQDSGAHAIVLLGSLASRKADAVCYGDILKTLGETKLPSFYIPGPDDAPFSEFLHQAHNFELVYPMLRGVHATFAMASPHVLVSGMGGSVEDDPKAIRNEVDRLAYPGWEVEYRLKFIHELKDYQKVFLFTAEPAHKGRHEGCSSVLAEVIKTYNPRLVVVAGRERKQEKIANSVVVTLGSLGEGDSALIDIHTLEVKSISLRGSMRAA